MKQIILSLFPGIGLLDMAFEEEGFCIVRGPDPLWGGDIRAFHPPSGVFAGIIGGPPCQAFSRLRHLVEHNGYQLAENLIPEFERCVEEAQPAWFLMENVPDAPVAHVRNNCVHAQLFNNRWCGGEQNRLRRFSFGTHDGRRLDIPGEVFEPVEWSPTMCGSGGVKPGIPTDRNARAKYLGWKTRGALQEAIRLQGLPDGFDLPSFTVAGALKAIGNGVPLPLGRAIAKAVKQAMMGEMEDDGRVA